ncbi:MAG: hypothetical protein H6909_01345 [Rickettsiaceae bacterium]|nr:hypothetical protein [Rickettsiaceae bacterium]
MYISNNLNKFKLHYGRRLLEERNPCQILISFILLLSLMIPINYSFASSSIEMEVGGPGGNIEGEIVDGISQGFSEGGVLDTIFDTLFSITCETQGVGNLLRTEFSHTCIAESLFTYTIANIVSPGLYANTFLRLTIRDEEMFPGNCTAAKRASFDDPRISFGMCSNTKLAVERVAALAGVGLEIVKTLFVDGDAWAGIISAWNLPKERYHNIYRDKPVGFTEYMFDIGLIPVFPIKVTKKNDRICVSTQSLTGWIPIGCKYINEPYPRSIYADFFDPNAELPNGVNTSSLTKCAEIGGCYRRAYDNSRSALVFSAPVIECVKEMIAKLMISRDVCSFDDVSNVLGSTSRATSSLFKFQQNMHKIVNALLAIYIILFGFKIVLSGNVPQKKELLEFLAKFIFVVYFSVGININPGSSDDLTRLDGMIQWAFPLLLGGMTGISQWIANANQSQLCNFNDLTYPVGLEHLALWDALDCRISHYLGLDRLLNLFSSIRDMDGSFNKADSLRFPIPAYFFLFIPAIITGIPFIVLAVLAYPILVISLLGFIVNATVVCMIGIVVLAVLAPLIVPTYLFNMTKGYFVTWAKLLVSFMLQPVVITAFLVAVLEVNDYGLYSTCKYIFKDTTLTEASSQEKAITAGLDVDGVLPTSERIFRMYDIDVDWKNYANEDEIRSCQESLGFFMNFPVEAIEGTANEMEVDENGYYNVRHSMYDILTHSPGLFFDMIEMVFDNFKKWLIQMITMTLLIYLMATFADQLAEFAADMTEGATISGMAIKPNSIGNAAKKAIKAAVKAAKQALDVGIMAATVAISGATGGAGAAPSAAIGTAVRTGISTASKVATKIAGKGVTKATETAAKTATKATTEVAKTATKNATNIATKQGQDAVKNIAQNQIKQTARNQVKQTGQNMVDKAKKTNTQGTTAPRNSGPKSSDNSGGETAKGPDSSSGGIYQPTAPSNAPTTPSNAPTTPRNGTNFSGNTSAVQTPPQKQPPATNIPSAEQANNTKNNVQQQNQQNDNTEKQKTKNAAERKQEKSEEKMSSPQEKGQQGNNKPIEKTDK